MMQDLLNQYAVEFLESGHHHCRPGWLQVKVCPWCSSENYHLGFSLGGRYFVCWKCRGHPLVPTLIKLGVPADQARAFSHEDSSTVEAVGPKQRAECLIEPAGLVDLLPAHKRYLRERGFKPAEIVDRWQVRGIGLAAELSWRIYIPVIQHGLKVSWTTRAIGQHVSQRYISASANQETVNHKHCIYGLDYCRYAVVIVEGPIDAWAVGPGAGALFGTAFTTAQVQQLATIPNRFVCFDSSPAAQADALSLSSQLSAFPGCTHNIVLDAKDPGSASARELQTLRRFAKLQ